MMRNLNFENSHHLPLTKKSDFKKIPQILISMLRLANWRRRRAYMGEPNSGRAKLKWVNLVLSGAK